MTEEKVEEVIVDKPYKVSFEIEVEAANPLEAAKQVQEMIQNKNNDWQFYVQDDKSKVIVSVDLQEEDEDAVLPVEFYEPLIYTV